MEKQVLSIEQMQELVKLGIDISKASCTWCKVRAITSDGKGYSWMILPETLNKFDEDHVPTFTLQDMLEIIPSFDLSKTSTVDPIVGIKCFKGYEEIKFASKQSLLDAAFSMLKWCKQKNYI